MKKMPPVEKIYEAFSALADGRVKMEETSAAVRSSNGAKTYTVQWEGDLYRSSDSATYWQGYPGYPVIAVLMLQGRLPCDSVVVKLFAGINWTELNKKHKRDYASAAAEVINDLSEKGANVEAVRAAAAGAYAALENLEITVGRASDKQS
ncbi:hypothetical protein K7I13_07965 [Brucepastera parasyntrophica]|uniref:hypothetical protein n=1 Tax=Brucepastera parasyntrophica TaxID=2880008 RepID=UPI00210C7C39|nr:hypothetical protein [Brucepastera parasyntrophica]ULQ58511.1 hypothetical protein K7I13_07965 [Brucepastera parasyntrophica]